MDPFNVIYKRLSALEASKYWIHEATLTYRLSMKADDCNPRRHQLNQILSNIKKGGEVVEPGGNPLAPIDLADTTMENDLGIHYVVKGRAETFPHSSTLGKATVIARPRWFGVGDAKCTGRLDISTQYDIVQKVVGLHAKVRGTAVGQRRQECWKKWTEPGRCRERNDFNRLDLPKLIDEYPGVLLVAESPKVGPDLPDGDYTKTQLGVARGIVIEILKCSNVLSTRSAREDTSFAGEKRDSEEESADAPTAAKKKRIDDSVVSPVLSSYALTIGDMRGFVEEHGIDGWKLLGTLQIMAEGISRGDIYIRRRGLIQRRSRARVSLLI
mmetsp:Transcript_32287/g.70961  ORF Transcript_32287/g.70961 Transcript_32287/m.70961 type:complete len:327 (-) Transcript_32287:513-1493(-)